MATVTGNVEVTEAKVSEPLWSVQTRVSWGALLAGAVVAISIYSLLAMLGIATGFSVSDRVDADQLGMAAAIWTIVTLLLAMFFGGWVATRCTAGEFRSEAVLYGVIVWGITSALLIPLTAAGVGMGVGTVLADRGLININNDAIPPMVNEGRLALNRAVNDPERQGNDRRESSAPGEGRDQSNGSNTREEPTSTSDEASSRSNDSGSRNGSNDQTSRQANSRQDSDRPVTGQARERLRTASWWAFGGTLTSLLAAVLGAVLGPTIVIDRHRYKVTNVGAVPAR